MSDSDWNQEASVEYSDPRLRIKLEYSKYQSVVKFVTWILQNSASIITAFFMPEYEAANFITTKGCFLQYVYPQHKISSYLNCVYARETIDNDLLKFVTQMVYKALWLLRHTVITKYLVGVVKFLKVKFAPNLGLKNKKTHDTILCELARYPVTHGLTPEAAEMRTAKLVRHPVN
jgi:hypothetical protein